MTVTNHHCRGGTIAVKAATIYRRVSAQRCASAKPNQIPAMPSSNSRGHQLQQKIAELGIQWQWL